jgi:hypothetical protein
VSAALTPAQLSGAICSLTDSGFRADSEWWLVQMLATAHCRVQEFGAAPAAALMFAAAELCGRSSSSLPSAKWVRDFSARFWGPLAAAAGGGGGGGAAAVPPSEGAPAPLLAAAAAAPPRVTLSGEQLWQGLWGSVVAGYVPSEPQWAAWEDAAGRLQWQLSLAGTQRAILAYKAAGRIMPRALSQRLQDVQQEEAAARRAEVEAAAAARTAAAAQLRRQQQKMQAAAAAVAVHQQRITDAAAAGAGAGAGGGGDGSGAAAAAAGAQ